MCHSLWLNVEPEPKGTHWHFGENTSSVKSHNYMGYLVYLWEWSISVFFLHYWNLPQQQSSKCIVDQVHQLSCMLTPFPHYCVNVIKPLYSCLHATAKRDETENTYLPRCQIHLLESRKRQGTVSLIINTTMKIIIEQCETQVWSVKNRWTNRLCIFVIFLGIFFWKTFSKCQFYKAFIASVNSYPDESLLPPTRRN